MTASVLSCYMLCGTLGDPFAYHVFPYLAVSDLAALLLLEPAGFATSIRKYLHSLLPMDAPGLALWLAYITPSQLAAFSYTRPAKAIADLDPLTPDWKLKTYGRGVAKIAERAFSWLLPSLTTALKTKSYRPPTWMGHLSLSMNRVVGIPPGNRGLRMPIYVICPEGATNKNMGWTEYLTPPEEEGTHETPPSALSLDWERNFLGDPLFRLLFLLSPEPLAKDILLSVDSVAVDRSETREHVMLTHAHSPAKTLLGGKVELVGPAKDVRDVRSDLMEPLLAVLEHSVCVLSPQVRVGVAESIARRFFMRTDSTRMRERRSAARFTGSYLYHLTTGLAEAAVTNGVCSVVLPAQSFILISFVLVNHWPSDAAIEWQKVVSNILPLLRYQKAPMAMLSLWFTHLGLSMASSASNRNQAFPLLQTGPTQTAKGHIKRIMRNLKTVADIIARDSKRYHTLCDNPNDELHLNGGLCHCALRTSSDIVVCVMLAIPVALRSSGRAAINKPEIFYQLCYLLEKLKSLAFARDATETDIDVLKRKRNMYRHPHSALLNSLPVPSEPYLFTCTLENMLRAEWAIRCRHRTSNHSLRSRPYFSWSWFRSENLPSDACGDIESLNLTVAYAMLNELEDKRTLSFHEDMKVQEMEARQNRTEKIRRVDNMPDARSDQLLLF